MKRTVMRTLWSDTASAGPVTHTLADVVVCDVLVVGGGYTGLSTALNLAEARVGVTLLEAEDIGARASGRNGGQVVPGLKPDPDAVAARFGNAAAERMPRIARNATETVFGLAERHHIECDATRTGWIQAAYSSRSLALIEARDALVFPA